MIYDVSPTAIVVFLLFVGFTLGLSFWLGRKAKSSEGYFAAHGQIPWFVNGVAFAGDYLSAASFRSLHSRLSFTRRLIRVHSSTVVALKALGEGIT